MRTLKEKTEEAISVAVRLNWCINELENASLPFEVKKAVDAIPDSVGEKILSEFRDFYMHDLSRADFIEVLKKQLKLRKRAMNRYIKLCEKQEDSA